MLQPIMTWDLCDIVRNEISRKEKEHKCFITLYMSTNSSEGCEMQAVYLNGTLGERKKISETTIAPDVASGIIRYFKED